MSIDKIIRLNGSSKNVFKMQLLLYALLNIVYIQVAPKYSYMFTKFTLVFQPLKFTLSCVLFFLLAYAIRYIRNDLLFFIYNIILLLIFDGEAICYTFNVDSRLPGVFGVSTLLLSLIVFQNIKFKMNSNTIVNSYIILVLLACAMFIPFLVLYYNKIDISNILLQNIYTTRALYREISNPIIGYLTAPLSRIILPFLIVICLRDKKYLHGIIFCLMITYIFLCGALKSIYFGLLGVLVFYKRGYREKIDFFLKGLIVVSAMGILLYALWNNVFIINLLRRIFFVPARLENFYVEYFTNNFTYLSHSSLGLGLVENKFSGLDLSRYFGENIMGYPGLNANVGVLTEGYISFGYVGILIISFIFSMIFQYIKSINVEPMFAGILFVYIYYMNTAFFSTLLLTHGLLFFIVFAYFFMRGRVE